MYITAFFSCLDERRICETQTEGMTSKGKAEQEGEILETNGKATVLRISAASVKVSTERRSVFLVH